MTKVSIGDVTLYMESYGSGEPLVLIGGFSVNHLVWQTVVDKFAEKYRVIVFDNRGAGQSDCPDVLYSIDMLADDTISLCEKLDISQAYFIGSSMGGMILQNIAYRYPQFVKAAVLENTNSKSDIRFSTFSKGRYELMKTNVDKKVIAQLTLPWVFSSAFLSQENVIDSLIQLTVADPYPMTMKGFQSQRNALDHFDSSQWLHKIKVPCLVTSSDKDMVFDESDMFELAKQIPHAKYHLFKNIGHVPHIECPEEFCKVVIDYFESLK